jgi:hypothetical protein
MPVDVVPYFDTLNELNRDAVAPLYFNYMRI